MRESTSKENSISLSFSTDRPKNQHLFAASSEESKLRKVEHFLLKLIIRIFLFVPSNPKLDSLMKFATKLLTNWN